MAKQTKETELFNRVLPTVAMRGRVAFPGNYMQLTIARAKSKRAAKEAYNKDKLIYLVKQKDDDVDNPALSDIYSVGVVAKIEKFVVIPEGELIEIDVKILFRAKTLEILRSTTSLYSRVEEYEEFTDGDEKYARASLNYLQSMMSDYISLVPRFPGYLRESIFSEKTTLSKAVNCAAHYVEFPTDKKQELLEISDLVERCRLLCEYIVYETDVLKIENYIDSKVQRRMDSNQRDYYLREQIKVINSELGDDERSEIESIREKIDALPVDVRSKKKLFDECDRLSRTSPGSPEANVLRTYLERVLALPWDKQSEDNLDVSYARKVIEKEHYGLEEVKERIVELVAVRNFAPEANAQILCLVGPPGVGKTSVVKSLAKAMGREYVRLALGGIHDESEIRGHRKTYVGSMPGRIIAAIEQAGTKNPLILLDEIDKLSKDYKGDPASALLEVLDAEQNNTFTDHYVEIPFDLSKVLFITTANDASQIPAPLYDRMEIIELYSYTAEDKFSIAKKHLIPKQLNNYGISNKTVRITDAAIRDIISGYTKEAGVRTLDRRIAKIIRKSAVALAEGSADKIVVNPKNLSDYLGSVKYKKEKLDLDDMVGAANGLAWTAVGGEMMQIEVAVLEGTGKLELTGSLGDVMKESAKAAISYIRANAVSLGIDTEFYKNKDIHIHVPEGAVPKDGPSAGVTITTALVSALSGKPVNKKVAMTGEITLRGRVLPIGGLREKSMAAFKNDMKTVLIPADNEADLDKVNDIVKKSINFIPVSDVAQVLYYSLGI